MTLTTAFQSVKGRPTNISRLTSRAFRALAGSAPIPVAAHREGQCRWPLGDGPFAYCGCATPDPNSNYCPAHEAIAHPKEDELATVPVFSTKDLERLCR